MGYAMTVLSIASIIIAISSALLAYKSLLMGKQSIDTLDDVRKEIEAEISKIKTTNENIQNLISKITRLFDASVQEGLEMIYPNRKEALREFTKFISKEQNEVVIVGSSLLGLFLLVTEFEDIIQLNPTIFKFILTHPEYSEQRADPEGRVHGAIKGEIIQGVQKLKEWKVPLENIQYYKGSPTVFMIVTSQHMLLNPYPYGVEAYHCFCIQIAHGSSIFKQYYKKHYEKIWDSAWTDKCSNFNSRLGNTKTNKQNSI